MSPAEIARTLRLRLAAELAGDRQTLGRLHDQVADLVAPLSDPRAERARTLALAFAVERWYSAVESVLERSLKTIDGDSPSGAGWHQELLRAASVAIDGGRPALVDGPTLTELRELLKFRHFARHGYGDDIDLRKVEEHAARIARVEPTLRASFDGFDAWLRRS